MSRAALFSQAALGGQPFGVSVSPRRPVRWSRSTSASAERAAFLAAWGRSRAPAPAKALEQAPDKTGERRSDGEDEGQASYSDDDADREDDHVLKDDRERDEDRSQRRKRVEP